MTSCSDDPPPRITTVDLGESRVVRRLDDRFLSFAIDSAQMTGGHFWGKDDVGAEGDERVPPFDFSRPRLINLTRALAPAYLRIGGTAADRVYYDLSDHPQPPPKGFAQTLTRSMWQGVNQFAREVDLEIMFTLNAGPGPRSKDGRWQPDNARVLVEDALKNGYPVTTWELGNEVHGFPLFHSFEVRPEAFVEDAATAKLLLRELLPGARLAAPASAYWPMLGEAVPFLPAFLAAGGGAHLDLLTWHYYPQQSERCPIAIRRARSGVLLDAAALDDFDRFVADLEAQKRSFGLSLPIWLGETGNAQCGGQAGVSNTFEGGFWWLDQLGKAARAGQVVIRQTLAGADYGLIDDQTLLPNPDYWSSVLWKRLMGPRVLAIETRSDERLRVYAHCTPEDALGFEPGSVTLAFVNFDKTRAASVVVHESKANRVELYEMTAAALDAREVALNGESLEVTADGSPPLLSGESVAAGAGARFKIAPLAYGFAVLVGAHPNCLP
jgi:hypothetical protein